MRAAARSPTNRLHDLLLDEPRQRPLLAIAAGPRGVGRQIVSQRDEGEGEFGLRLARLLLLLDQVGDRECLALHRERGVGRDAALGEDREVLGGVPLHADALQGHHPVVGGSEHHLPAAAAAHVGPADRADGIACRTAHANLGGDAEGDEAMHDFPGSVLRCVERSPLVDRERLRDPGAEPLESLGLRRRGAGRLEPGDDERRRLPPGLRRRRHHRGGRRGHHLRLRLVARIGGGIDDLRRRLLQFRAKGYGFFPTRRRGRPLGGRRGRFPGRRTSWCFGSGRRRGPRRRGLPAFCGQPVGLLLGRRLGQRDEIRRRLDLFQQAVEEPGRVPPSA